MHDSLKHLFSFSHSIFFIVVYTRAGVVYFLSLAPAAPYGHTSLIPLPYRLRRIILPKCRSDLAQYRDRRSDGVQHQEIGRAGAAAELARGVAHSQDTANLEICGQHLRSHQASTQKSG